MKYLNIVLLSFLIVACTTTIPVVVDSKNENTVQDDTAQREKVLADNGFIKATVIDMSSENGCGFVLKTEDKKLYQPTKWIVPEYKTNGNVVYILYQKAEGKSSCDKATLIDIQEIKLLR